MSNKFIDRIKKKFINKEEKYENHFVTPKIQDRNIEKFKYCTFCKHSFGKNNENITTEQIKIDKEDITVVRCKNCNTLYYFRNYKEEGTNVQPKFDSRKHDSRGNV